MSYARRFTSKKNKVTLEDGIVVKRHQNHDALLREASILEHLYQGGLAVPVILGLTEDALRLEYVEGPTYVDLVDTLTPAQAGALGDWLAKYHRLTRCLRGDCNLRNFLWSKGRCVGVDFEDELEQGEEETDMGKILAFAVTYNPSFTMEKAHSARLLLQTFCQTGGEPGKIKVAYLAEIVAMNQRRNGEAICLQSAASFFDELL